VLRNSDAAAAEREIRVKGVAIMVKRIIVASALALFSIGLAGAGGAATPGLFAAVQACEAQMHRMAGLNKTLAANYNAERVHDECVMSAREAVASK
jgi:hypothetical protein